MAFTQETFATVGAQATDTPTIYSYKSTDTLETVRGDDYFSDKSLQLEDGDIIFVDGSNGDTVLQISADKSTGVNADFVYQVDDQIVVNVKSDFPDPVGGVITLLADKQYLIGADINIGTDRFVLSNNTAIRGLDSVVTVITYTGTGDMFTSVDVVASISNLSLVATAGRLFNITDTGSRIFRARELIVNCDKWGLFTSTSDAIIRFSNVAGTMETDGLEFSGDFRTLFWDTGAVTINNGAIFNLGVATFDSFIADAIVQTLNGTSNTISGAAGSANINAGGEGLLERTFTSGTGTELSGVTKDDALWQFFGNSDIPDTRPDGLLSMQANATNSVISVQSTYVLVAGTWVIESTSQFTGTTAGRLTYNGGKDAKLPITFSCSVEPVSGGAQDISIQAALNGVAIPNSKRTTRTSAGTPASITLPWQENLSTGDFIEVFIANDSTTNDVLVASAISRIN